MSLSYQNPVYPRPFADPFVLKTSGGYYAYGTAPGDARQFPVLKSADLVYWQRLSAALEPLANPAGVSYWAPEVAEHQGRFYMFYSASTTSSDDSHRVRVATATDPAGPFRDSGRILLPDAGFTIDASPFRDPRSGHWYLFFAMDFVEDEPYGTGLAAVELADDLLSLNSAPVMLMRARHDWQVYQRNRNYKDRLWNKWCCLEGPHCLYHNDRYYLFFSGGAWFGENYGVEYAVANHPLGPWQTGNNGDGPSVLKGIPGKVIGPGHSCCVQGDQQLFMVYHAWDAGKIARRMCIDPLLWTDGIPHVDGPSVDTRTV